MKVTNIMKDLKWLGLFFLLIGITIFQSGCSGSGGSSSNSTSCTSNAQCLSGQVCQNGSCVTQNTSCTSNAACSSGYICQNGSCVAQNTNSCTSNAQCQNGYICQNDKCIANSPPVISGITASPNPVVKGGTMNISVNATDPDGDTLSYTWSIPTDWKIQSGGSTSQITIIAPNSYSITETAQVIVADNYGGNAVGSITISTVNNQYPVINSISINPNPVFTSTTLSCDAYDPDGDSLAYTWTIGGINVTTDSTISTTTWYSPGISGYYIVNVSVDDGYGGIAFSSTNIYISSNSPWPRLGRDLGSTGLSSANTSSTTGALKWSYTTSGPIYSPPVIGADGTIYVGSTDDNLYAINPNGSLKWSFPTGAGIESSAAIGADGTIYIGSTDGNLYAIYPTGGLKWSYTTVGSIDSSPNFGADGTIYIGAGYYDTLYAINPDGSLKWVGSSPYNFSLSSPTIGPDGTIYFDDINGLLYAISPDGSVKWRDISGLGAGADETPVIKYGILFGVVGSGLDAIFSSNGSLYWSYDNLTWYGGSPPAIGPDDTVYFGDNQNGALVALNFTNGAVKWSFPISGYIDYDSPVVGSDGTIYIGSDDYNLYAINPNGSLKWSFPTGGNIESSAAIGTDGTIYIGSTDGNLYAIH